IRSTGIKNKLNIADQYRLIKLTDHYHQSITTLQELQKLKSEAGNFSDETMVAICRRFFEI
ncbi:hypothetical protein PENTCL1PPCAC_19289, partial [Pristionchus entomophagus]